jgi:hypothetical protein
MLLALTSRILLPFSFLPEAFVQILPVADPAGDPIPALSLTFH